MSIDLNDDIEDFDGEDDPEVAAQDELEEFLSQAPAKRVFLPVEGPDVALESEHEEDREIEAEDDENDDENEDENEDEQLEPSTQQKTRRALIAARVVSLATTSDMAIAKEAVFGIAELVR